MPLSSLLHRIYPSARVAPRLLSLVVLLLFAACVRAGQLIPAPATPTPEPLPSTTPLPSATSTLAPTEVPTATRTPTPQPCRETRGQVERKELLSPYLSRPLNYSIYTPPCYDASGQTRYPVLYMLHGQTFKDDQWVRLGMTTSADRLISAGEIRPFLIVMPYEVDTFADPYHGGYTDALLDTLIPWINAFYPVCPDRECRAIGGLSRGGAYAFLLALDHPNLFVEAGGHSMVPFGGMKTRLPKELAAMPPGQFPRLTTDMGKNDIFMPDLTAYEKLLTQENVPHEFTVNPGNHDEDYWSSHVEEYLRWYAAGFPQE